MEIINLTVNNNENIQVRNEKCVYFSLFEADKSKIQF